MSNHGYYRYASIHKDKIVFVCEDDLWMTSIDGGLARRLTTGSGEFSLPRFSPAGDFIAFAGLEEGHTEVYVIPCEGGAPKRLTYLGGTVCVVSGWRATGSEILFATDAKSPFIRHTEAFAISYEGGMPEPLNLGHVLTIAEDKGGRLLLGRNNHDPARWKRYRGGTAGDLWFGDSKDGPFNRLIKVNGNPVWPMWIDGRAFFLSDHEGIGNIYSCSIEGADLQRHTDHSDYFVRFPSTDGERIAYTAGGRIYVLDVAKEEIREVPVRVPVATMQVNRKFVGTKDNLEHFAPHPEGHSMALIVRGQPVTAPFWEEAPVQYGEGSHVRYRAAEWLSDGKRFIVTSDATGKESIELHYADQSHAPETVLDADMGRILELAVSPVEDVVALANHRQELMIIDLPGRRAEIIDRSPAERLSGLSFSADGRWLAYSWSPYSNTSLIRVAEVRTGKVRDVTQALRVDRSPRFDPKGRYLYFLSTRDFNPVYDHLQFDLSFPMAMRPFLVTLRKDVQSPFVAARRRFVTGEAVKEDVQTQGAVGTLKQKGGENGAAERVEIDFDGIGERIIGFPVDEARYEEIVATPNRVLFTQFEVKGIRPGTNWWTESSEVGKLMAYDFDEQRLACLEKEVGAMRLAQDHRTLVYRSKEKMRVIDAQSKLPEEGQEPKPPTGAGRKSGWIDLDRIKILVEPKSEWKQMYEEAWRLQHEQFWDEKMSDIDWKLVRDRYLDPLERARTRTEVSDIIWEMQGELGTSHAYELGGDHRPSRAYDLGFLGADLVFDDKTAGYRIERIIRGCSWEANADSPLAEPGLEIAEGDVIVAVGGRKVRKDLSVDELLLNAARTRVTLTIKNAKGETRRVFVSTLAEEKMLRYRAWVEGNRKHVHERTGGRVGYVHIPDMGPWGFAEFHRSYLCEINRHGLIVDVRYNRGGHVSPLLLEKLARKRVGYDVNRWGQPMPYPPESVAGPMVGLTNQFAGSDGDIFSHCFKLYKLGPLVGKRTWGGVIGIWPRHRLVDGTVTTQPEFSFWFSDVGYRVENYGTDPDHDVDIRPDDYRRDRDPQMEKAIELILHELELRPFTLPDFSQRPSLALPTPVAAALGKGRK
ncbi:MAG TPA: PDZ domain-containing protein [Candidatus Obscuribacterales bacterium]